MVEVIVVLCSTLTDKVSPSRPVCCHVLPSFHVDVALFKVCFNIVLKPLLLTSWGPLSFNKLGVKHLFWEARVRHSNNMARPSELILGNGGSDGENVSLLQNAGVSAPVFPADPQDLSKTPLMVRLKCP